MIQSMTVSELKTMMEGGEPPVLIDCREQNEWDQGHIPGAVLLPLSTLDRGSRTLEDKKSRTLVLQCRSGKRSMRACQFLKEQGFGNLYNLEGGILAWMENGYVVESQDTPQN